MDIEKIIEFDKIKEMWMNLTVTEGAKEKIRKMSYCLEETKLRKMMRDTTQGKNLMEKLGTPPLQNTGEIHETISAMTSGLNDISVAVDESAKGVTNVAESAVSLVASMSQIQQQSISNQEISEQLSNEVGRFKHV